jgi:hypothetical protein
MKKPDLYEIPCAYSEAYEDNGGGLYLCLFDSDDNCIAIFENFEYGETGILSDSMMELVRYPYAARDWDGDLCERLENENFSDGENPVTFQYVVDMITENQLIASTDSHGILTVWNPERIGFAGRKALAIEDDE